MIAYQSGKQMPVKGDYSTVEPRFNEPLYNEVLGLTNNIVKPVQSYSKMYGTGPRYNEQISSVTWHFVKSRFHCTFF